MNIQPYILPASLAAAFHVAVFLSGTPGAKVPVVPIHKAPLSVDDRKTVEIPLYDPPADAEKTDDQTVKPLIGDEVPTLPEQPVSDSSSGIVVVVLDQPTRPVTADCRIPIAIGSPDGSPEGLRIPITPGVPDITQLENQPRTLAQVAPEYPSNLRRDGVDGEVYVEFVVGTDGRVRSANVVKCNHPEFAAPTVRAVLKWRFEPGKKNGRAVPFRMAVPVNFHAESI